MVPSCISWKGLKVTVKDIAFDSIDNTILAKADHSIINAHKFARKIKPVFDEIRHAMLQGVRIMAQAGDFKIDDVPTSILWRTLDKRNGDGDTVAGEEAEDGGEVMASEKQ
ncbi:hypothetical protein HBI56_089630 [Parastagonospora nodorum]|uniref:Uncharacterized protein n=1 Tax=Phaeosphaeria nodorum (strain SN15 / ATCC MYA-4574 / FGSC 10173) TaxID=321614 RepID=A0A7U2FDJ4_PHANO|nr:hypothetical protein HBH56_109830 [Parastagonospora nodorum]QRD03297.1 hypothetical protein JI435_441820 [Parastagonospora nodorum SN15]KAH3925563.1 hypothetical protein HBH54_180510 [Parastagonospora nodorum]KAH3999645.1 hypothetical protein HBI10_112810 [Parastagonospora nodorum]KAH4014669.1 hypothetical protein HBI13_169140 [Parastagonospora nodorum]